MKRYITLIALALSHTTVVLYGAQTDDNTISFAVPALPARSPQPLNAPSVAVPALPATTSSITTQTEPLLRDENSHVVPQEETEEATNNEATVSVPINHFERLAQKINITLQKEGEHDNNFAELLFSLKNKNNHYSNALLSQADNTSPVQITLQNSSSQTNNKSVLLTDKESDLLKKALEESHNEDFQPTTRHKKRDASDTSGERDEDEDDTETKDTKTAKRSTPESRSMRLNPSAEKTNDPKNKNPQEKNKNINTFNTPSAPYRNNRIYGPRSHPSYQQKFQVQPQTRETAKVIEGALPLSAAPQKNADVIMPENKTFKNHAHSRVPEPKKTPSKRIYPSVPSFTYEKKIKTVERKFTGLKPREKQPEVPDLKADSEKETIKELASPDSFTFKKIVSESLQTIKNWVISLKNVCIRFYKKIIYE
ncbi:hypothetical protein K9K77_02125 [Candidatus Babeliales bacterium]|nr:hypothetical protein [Candidatus Babeliales bacterium]